MEQSDPRLVPVRQDQRVVERPSGEIREVDGAENALEMNHGVGGGKESTRPAELVAPEGTFTHWVLYDIPSGTTALTQPSHGRSLANDFGRPGYGGPCPPRGHGPHRYVFSLYALEVPVLDVLGRSRAGFDRGLRAHMLGVARLTGRYQRRGA